MISIDKVNQLISFLLAWALTQTVSSPSTTKGEIILALREAADRLEEEQQS